MSNFSPETNEIDKRILFEITGRRKPDDKFTGDSSCSDEENSKDLNHVNPVQRHSYLIGMN